MSKSRLETMTDGVIAVIITVMVLEMRVPRATTFAALRSVLPVFLSYALSFVYIAIYWNNHHHLLQAAERVTGVTLWANMHLLFWLALVPFATAWMDQDADASAPVEALRFNTAFYRDCIFSFEQESCSLSRKGVGAGNLHRPG